MLEPELAASVVGHLGEADFRRLRETVRLYDHRPGDAKLNFHGVLAELCPNPVLASQALVWMTGS